MDYSAVYRGLHANPKYFAGYSLIPHVERIAALVKATDAQRILDYGCGKGFQYLARRAHEGWGGILPHCYDPGLKPLAGRPEGKFDGIICTDVMEHIEEADVGNVLADIHGMLLGHKRSFVFFSICCRASHKGALPDGRNVHVTIKPPWWWDVEIERVFNLADKSVTVDTVFDLGKGYD